MLGPHAGHQGMATAAVPMRAGELGRVIATVRPLDLASPVLLSPPARAGVPWTASSNAADRPRRADVEVDGPSGRIVGRVDFADRHWIDRLIGYGIAVHEGALFGIVNQLLGTITALLLVVLAASGIVLWWRRRPTGLLGAPLPLTRPRFRTALVAAIIALGVFMPLFGTTLLLVLAVELLILRRQPALQRWLSLRPASA